MQGRAVRNPCGTFAGHRPIEAEIQAFRPSTPTPEQAAAHQEILRHIAGTWTAADDSDAAAYPVLIIRSDGTFRVNSNRGKVVSEGTWSVDGRVLLLKKGGAAPAAYYGFHAIDHIDDHNLVCGIGMSVAGRLRFTK